MKSNSNTDNGLPFAHFQRHKWPKQNKGGIILLKNHFLSQSLLQAWKNYKSQVHLSRRKASPKNIHQLRIATQRLEAMLTLIDGLKPTDDSKVIVSSVKKVRKNLGPLRDCQVESNTLNHFNESKSKKKSHKGFFIFFKKEKIDIKKKARKILENISLKPEKKCLDKLAKKLTRIEELKNKKQIQHRLALKIKSTQLKFKRALRKIDPERAKKIHKFRILAKKLRYQEEYLNTIMGSSQANLDHLKTVQSVAGKIQNDTVLLETMNRYLAKRHRYKDTEAIKIRKRIERNQAKIIKTDFNKLCSHPK